MLLLVLILIGFFLMRLYHLTVMPPFLDELIYVRWLNEIRLYGNWLIPLKEFGWEPLQIWLAALVNQLVSDPLFSLRLTGAIISSASLVLIYKLAGKTAALFYLLSPIILLHDRLGLRGDNLVVLAALMVFYGLTKRLPIWIGLGIAVGLFSKTTAAALPIVVLVSYFWLKIKPKGIDFVAAALAAAPVIFYFFSGTLVQVLAKQETFVGGWMLKNNLLQIGQWLYQYLTWPVVLLVVVGFIVSRKNHLLQINSLLPLVLLAVWAKILFPRYLLPVWPFLLIFAAIGFNWLRQALPRTLRPLLLVFWLAPAWFSGQILQDVTKAPLPEIDQWQYVTGWPSGYGVQELIDYWQDNRYSAEEILTDKAKNSVYAVTNINHEGVGGELIQEFPRPGNKSSLKLWRLQ